MLPSNVRSSLMWLDENLERYLLIVTYFYITFIIIMGVFNRFVLQSTSGWEVETARLLFIWLTWIGASLAVRQRSHIRIDFIYQYVSDRTEGLLYIFSDLVIIGFCVVAFDAFVPVLQTTSEFGASLVTIDLSVIFFQAAVPVGLGLMTVRGVQMLVFDTRSVLNGQQVYQGERLFEIYEDEDQGEG
jgi:TRAP-type C4-dicarboxylate transport system permease small subunit